MIICGPEASRSIDRWQGASKHVGGSKSASGGPRSQLPPSRRPTRPLVAGFAFPFYERLSSVKRPATIGRNPMGGRPTRQSACNSKGRRSVGSRAPASVCPPAALQSRNAARTMVPGASRRRRPRIGPAATIPVVRRSIPQRVGPGFRPVRWVGRASHCSRSARTASSVRVTTPNRSNRRDR
jgi:hypothetical protein